MSDSDGLGAWAAAFLRQQELEARPVARGDVPPAAPKYPGVTPAAGNLLASIDAGGVPAFITASLLQIASDNGLQVAPDWTPNDIVAALRQKAGA